MAEPVVESIYPTQGQSNGGTKITVSGTGMGGATAVYVGDTIATDLAVISSTAVSASVPEGEVGASPVTVKGSDTAATGVYAGVHWVMDHNATYEWTVTPLSDPTPDGYFWAHSFGWLATPTLAYCGMQTLGTGLPGKCVVFSCGDGAIDAVGSGIIAFDFDGGPGISTRISYDWEEGKSYRFKVEKGVLDGTGQWWDAYITDIAEDDTTLIASIAVPGAWGGLGNYSSVWTERYGGFSRTCESFQHSIVEFTDFLANTTEGPVSITSSLYETIRCPTSSAVDIAGGSRQEVGIPLDEVYYTYLDTLEGIISILFGFSNSRFDGTLEMSGEILADFTLQGLLSYLPPDVQVDAKELYRGIKITMPAVTLNDRGEPQ